MFSNPSRLLKSKNEDTLMEVFLIRVAHRWGNRKIYVMILFIYLVVEY